jgi:hypothetical protein
MISNMRSVLLGAVLAAAMALPAPTFGETKGRPSAGQIAQPRTEYKVQRYKKKLLAAYTEYYPSTCEEVSPGSWSVNTSPKYGQVSFDIISGNLASGDCPGTTFTFAAIYYKWTEHNNKSITDPFTATWTSPSFVFPFSFDIKVKVVRPSSETTVFNSWDGATGGLGKWEQTLHPPADDPTFDFSPESVREKDAGGGGPDTCWFSGSAFSPFTAITGGTWPVKTGNTWGFDYVGWFSTAVTYYRAQGRAPCGTTFPQQMTIKSPADKSYKNYAVVNTLGGKIGTSSVTSIRAGKKRTRNK